MGHPPHPRVTPSGKGGSRRPHRGGKPSSERRSAAGARLINLGPFQSRPRPRPARPFAPPLTAHSLPHSFPGWLRGPEPRKLLFSATGDSRERPSRPATHADARRALRGHPHRPASPQAVGLSANSLNNEDGAARRGRLPGCAWNAKLSLCPREPALGTRAGLREPSEPVSWPGRARRLGTRLASRRVPQKCAFLCKHLSAQRPRGYCVFIFIHIRSRSLTRSSWNREWLLKQ